MVQRRRMNDFHEKTMECKMFIKEWNYFLVLSDNRTSEASHIRHRVIQDPPTERGMQIRFF